MTDIYFITPDDHINQNDESCLVTEGFTWHHLKLLLISQEIEEAEIVVDYKKFQISIHLRHIYNGIKYMQIYDLIDKNKPLGFILKVENNYSMKLNQTEKAIIQQNLNLSELFKDRPIFDMLKEQENLISQWKKSGYTETQFYLESQLIDKNFTLISVSNVIQQEK